MTGPAVLASGEQRDGENGARIMKHPLAREVAFWLGVKVVALGALFFLFFGPEHRVTVTPESVERKLLAPASTPAGGAPDMAKPAEAPADG